MSNNTPDPYATRLELPRSVTFDAVLGLADLVAAPANPLEVIVRGDTFFTPGGVGLLCALLLQRRQAGQSVRLSGAQLKLDHLVRLGLFAFLDLKPPPFPTGRPAAGRYIPLTLITTGEEVTAVTNAICDLMSADTMALVRSYPRLNG